MQSFIIYKTMSTSDACENGAPTVDAALADLGKLCPAVRVLILALHDSGGASGSFDSDEKTITLDTRRATPDGLGFLGAMIVHRSACLDLLTGNVDGMVRLQHMPSLNRDLCGAVGKSCNFVPTVS